MKETLVGCVQNQLSHLDTVDAKELGEVVDMIKDLEEAIYYSTITKSMTEKEDGKEKEHHYYYTEHYPIYRDMDKRYGKMYYEEPKMDRDRAYYGGDSGHGASHNGGNNGYEVKGYYEKPFEIMRDMREGRSPMSRKTYMESREMHQDKSLQMRELEKYLQELSTDITELIEDASPEEKQLMQQKISNLATKIK